MREARPSEALGTGAIYSGTFEARHIYEWARSATGADNPLPKHGVRRQLSLIASIAVRNFTIMPHTVNFIGFISI